MRGKLALRRGPQPPLGPIEIDDIALPPMVTPGRRVRLIRELPSLRVKRSTTDVIDGPTNVDDPHVGSGRLQTEVAIDMDFGHSIHFVETAESLVAFAIEQQEVT